MSFSRVLWQSARSKTSGFVKIEAYLTVFMQAKTWRN